jgi:hypothetical protein
MLADSTAIVAKKMPLRYLLYHLENRHNPFLMSLRQNYLLEARQQPQLLQLRIRPLAAAQLAGNRPHKLHRAHVQPSQ